MAPRSKIQIPLARGLGQGVDERVRAPAVLSEATNADFLRTGALTKRHGFTALATAVVGGGNPSAQGNCKSLFSTGTELCIRGHRSLYTFNSNDDLWLNRGPLSPMTGELETVYHDQLSWEGGDTWRLGNYIAYIGQSQRQTDEVVTNVEYAASFRATTTDHHVLIANYELASDTDATAVPHSVKAAACTGKLLVSWLAGNQAGTAASLVIAAYATASPNSNPPTVKTIANVYHATWDNRRTYDMIEMANGNYAVAWIDHTSREITVSIFNSSHAQQATVQIAATQPYSLVSLHHDSANSRIYVLAVAEPTGGGTRQVEMWSKADTTLGAGFGPIVLYTIPVGEDVTSLGVAEGTNSDGDDRICAVWTVVSGGDNDTKGNAIGLDDWSVDSRSLSTGGADLDTRLRIYNTLQLSKPFWQGARCYVVASTATGGVAVDSHVILDLDPMASDAARTYTLAGVYDVGVSLVAGSSGLNLATRVGTGNAVYQTGASTGIWRHMSTSVAYVIEDSTTERARYSQDRLEYDFAKPSTNALVTRGAALIGGGQVDWYGGVIAEELGYAHPPFILGLNPSNTASGTLSVSTTYSYQVMWEGYDERGIWHRSQPSPVKSQATGGADDTMDVTCCSLGATNRIDRRNMGLVVYRAAADGIYARISDPIRAIRNTGAHWYCDVYRDFGIGDVGETLYTLSGAEVGAIQPEGARIAMVNGRRVWLGGFYRRDRIQYSKLATAGSPNEDAIAPEFNEAFSFILPGGERCTGLAGLDDKVVVLTESSLYLIAGSGPDDGGRNDDFSGLSEINAADGCTEPRSVVTYPGGVMYLGKEGFYRVGRGLDVSLVGDPVLDEIAAYPTVTSAVSVPKRSQLRFTCLSADQRYSIVLIYDYSVKAWLKWIPLDSAGAQLRIVGSCVHNDVYHLLETDGTVWKEDASTYYDDATRFVPMSVETGWIQAARQGGWQRVRNVSALASRKDPHNLSITLYQDFETGSSQTYQWTEAIIDTMAQPAVRLQPVMRVLRQKCTAIKIKIADTESASSSSGQGYDLAGFMLEVQEKRGPVKVGSMQRN